MCRLVDDAQQAFVDGVAVRQQLVEVHRAHHGTDVGHRQVEDGVLQPGDLVGGLRGVEHLVEGDAVDGDGGVVAGDDLLGRDVEHLLHHVQSGADAVDERHDEVEAGAQCLGIAAKAFDGIIVALRDCPDAFEKHEHDKSDKDKKRDIETTEIHLALPQMPATKCFYATDFTKHLSVFQERYNQVIVHVAQKHAVGLEPRVGSGFAITTCIKTTT
ncbi:hypothetical protein MES4922_290054 [Mesorhizobium ventifaucium]|uniref:Uncharacterized protein n=1 Tax=Mesorhizobium ventifaucium TaxID=666020 RepID=A0ABM9DWL1_9HYPH|nr:hypothetical protein MES4922_290054 [Mesorhizobium ventifaucium]